MKQIFKSHLENICVGILSLSAALMSFHLSAATDAEIEKLEQGSEELQYFITLMEGNLARWSFHKSDERFDDAGDDYSKRPDALFADTAPPI